MRFQSQSVHQGVYKDATFNSVTTPIYPTSTFYFERIGVHKGYDYTRSGNPTRAALEENLAALEGGAGAVVCATGMAAITTCLFLLESGDHVIAGHDIYGGTYRLFADVLPRLGITFSFIDMRDPANTAAAVGDHTKMIWIETPSNPLLNIVDIAATCRIARDHGLLSVCDNTFLSPYFQRPLDLGCDLVVHSTTKYLNGHSDVVGGAVIARTPELAQRIAYLANALGTPGSPFDAFLTLRGIKTLVPRMQLHQHNALQLARWLAGHPRVKKVYYPGLPDHPQRQLIDRQMTGYGGMLSFDIDAPADRLDDFFGALQLFLLAESLGGVESLIEQPWTMSHASMGPDGLAGSGITPQTIRVSVGLEDIEDLVADLERGFQAVA